MFKSETPVVRERMLKDNADKVVEHGYMRQFTPDEIVMLKHELSETSIQIADVLDEKKRFLADIKLQMKPLATEQGALLGKIKLRSEYVKEICFEFIDHETNVVEIYNPAGDLVDTRSLQPSERQKTIFQANVADFEAGKTGTHD